VPRFVPNSATLGILYWIALVHVGFGETDQALLWLRAHWLVWLKLDPRFDACRAFGGAY